MSRVDLCSMNEVRGINWFFRYRWYRIWMVTQETCVLLVELPTGNINAVLLLDEGNLPLLTTNCIFKKMFKFQKFQIFIMLVWKTKIS